MLDPQARALLDLMIAGGVPPMHTQTPAEGRAAYRDRRGYAQPEPPPVAEVRDAYGQAIVAILEGGDAAQALQRAAEQMDDIIARSQR